MGNFRFRGGDLAYQDGSIGPGEIDIVNDKIASVYPKNTKTASELEIVNLSGFTIAPGYIDLHVNGGMGETFEEASAQGMSKILATYLQFGTTSLLGTLNTAPTEIRVASLERLQNWTPGGKDFVEFLGVYLEGPYYNPEQRGAHQADWMHDPDPEEYGPWLARFGNLIRVLSLAPERKGGLELIRELDRRGIVPAVGHSMATDEKIVRAIEAGAKLVTHLYNAQSTFYRGDVGKHLGVAEMGLMRDELTVEIVPDGHHLTAQMLAFVVKVKSRDRICIVTDAMHATGLGPGNYEVMGQVAWVTDDVAYRADRKRHAGSILTMDRGVRNVVEAGVPLGEAVRMASTIPARVIGVDDRKGKLLKGYDADLVVLDEQMNVSATVCRGRVAYAGDDSPLSKFVERP